MPADFYLRMVIVWLTAAILPVAIISLVSALVIRISALWKHREIIATVGGIAFFIGYMFLMMNVGQITGDAADGGEMISQLILSNTARIQSMTGLFPPAAWAAEGILGNWAKLGLFVLVSIAAIGLSVPEAEPAGDRDTGVLRKGRHPEGRHPGRERLPRQCET